MDIKNIFGKLDVFVLIQSHLLEFCTAFFPFDRTGSVHISNFQMTAMGVGIVGFALLHVFLKL